MAFGFGLGLGIAQSVVSAATDPLHLFLKQIGAYAAWDAETKGKITRSGSLVTSWKDVLNDYNLTQGVNASRPTYSTTNFNGRPSVVFDGIDDVLSLLPLPESIPSGSTTCEIWLLMSADRPVENVSVGAPFYYGNATSAVNGRRIDYGPNSGVVRARIAANGVNRRNDNVDFAGIHVTRATYDAALRIDVDGVGSGTSTSVTLSTDTEAVRMGATANGTSGFCEGKMNFAAITPILTTENAASLLAMLKARGGIE